MMPNCRWIRILLRMLYQTVFMALLLFFFSITILGELPGLFVLSALLLLFVLSFAIREWMPSHLLILLFHLLLFGGIYILPCSIGMRILLMIIQAYLTVSSLVYSYKGAVIKPMTDIPWPSFLTCTIIYILSIMTHLSALTSRTYIITILLLVIYYIMVYVEGLNEYIDSARTVSGLPLKRMLHTNTIIIGIVIFLLLFGLFLGYIFGSDELTDAIGDALQWFFQMLFHVILFLIEWISKWLTQYLGLQDIDPTPVDDDLSAGEQATGWGLIVELILMVVFLAVVSLLLYHLMRRLICLLLKPRTYGDDIIEEAEKGKTLEREKSRGRAVLYHRQTLAEKARRYYKRRVLRHKDEIVLVAQSTCRDIEQEIEEKEQEDIHELTELYARLRYGGQEPDKAMVKRIRELAGK